MVASRVPGGAGGCGPCFFPSSLLCPGPEQIPLGTLITDVWVTMSYGSSPRPPPAALRPSQASVSPLSAVVFTMWGS